MAVRGIGAQGEGDNRDRAPCPQAGSRKGDCRELWVGSVGLAWADRGWGRSRELLSSSFTAALTATTVIGWGLLLTGDLFLLEKGFKKHLTETIT